METYLLAVLYVVLYVYYIFQITTIAKGKGKNIVAVLMAMAFALGGVFVGWSAVAYLFVTVVLFLFAVFYSDEPVIGNRIRILLPGILLMFHGIVGGSVYFFGAYCLILFFLLSQKRGYLNVKNGILVSAMTVGIIALHANVSATIGMLLVLFFLLDSTLRAYQLGYDRNAREFQHRLMHQQ